MIFVFLFVFICNGLHYDSCPESTIQNSNRNSKNPCHGHIGSECDYKCDSGYVKIGRHVCQFYQAGGQIFINNTFHGGRCIRLCQDNACKASQSTLRFNSKDKDGYCLETKCFKNDDDLLMNILHGNFEAWKLARNENSGFYSDGVNIIDPSADRPMAATGVTGLGLVSEVVGHALGFQTWDTFKARVALTLRSILGLTNGINIPRDDRGFFIHFMNPETGKSNEATTCLMCTGLLMAGAKMVMTYAKDVNSTESRQIEALVDKLWESIHFEDILCGHDHNISPNATGIPMTQSLTENTCPNGAQFPKQDGYYQFNEEHYTIWFAFEKFCENFHGGKCPNQSIENMWNAWQGRRRHPIHHYAEYDLLSMWSGYLVQLPYYTCSSFNSDSEYLNLFRNHWQADWLFYNTTQISGERGRYGLGAGPVPQWCTEGSGYIADRLDPSCKSHCRIYSPYITAGYLPAAPEVILPQLMELISDGETVFPVPQTDYFIFWRKSMIDYEWPTTGATARLTMVDFSSEFFGLSTLYLGDDFFPKYTKYFTEL